MNPEERVNAVRDAIKLVEQTKGQFSWKGGVDETYYNNLAEAAIAAADATRPKLEVTDAMVDAGLHGLIGFYQEISGLPFPGQMLHPDLNILIVTKVLESALEATA